MCYIYIYIYIYTHVLLNTVSGKRGASACGNSHCFDCGESPRSGFYHQRGGSDRNQNVVEPMETETLT